MKKKEAFELSKQSMGEKGGMDMFFPANQASGGDADSNTCSFTAQLYEKIREKEMARKAEEEELKQFHRDDNFEMKSILSTID